MICGKEMAHPDGSATIGMKINIVAGSGWREQGEELSDHVKKQLGPYTAKSYECCWECFLRNSGFKPEAV